MQLLRYRDQNGTWLGVLKGQAVVSVHRALNRYLETDGRLDFLWEIAEPIAREPKVALALAPASLDLIAEAVERDDGSSVVTDGGLSELQVLPFVPNPEKVFGLGYNFKALCEKEGVEESKYPQVFTKLPTSVAGPFDEIDVPLAIDKVDYESELCVVIGRTARQVSPDQALSYVAGYTIMNDATAKILPRPGVEAMTTTVGLKGADGFGPVGAVVVTADEAGDPAKLWLTAHVNGEQRQRYPMSDAVHDVAATVAYISARITLNPGDLIAMGTSLGIGIVEVPPRLLNDGDTVECAIEGYPGCRNVFRIPAQR